MSGTKTLKAAGTRLLQRPPKQERTTYVDFGIVKNNEPKVLSSLEQLKVLSKMEQLGVLSKLEAVGINLEFIEKNKLLSKAEAVGAVGLLSNTETPTNLTVLGLFLITAAAGSVVAIPDDTTSLLVGQYVLAGVLGSAGVASVLGGGFIGELQKER